MAKNWREICKKAKSYKAIGQTEVYLSDGDDKPWALVNKIESGALHRFNTSVSISFEAAHCSGMSFRWSEDMEDRKANGTGRFHIDVTGLRRIAYKLPRKMKPEFRKVICAASEHVKKQAEEIRATAADLQEMYLQMERVVEP